MAELLLGGPRTGRDHTVKDPDPGQTFPGGEIYLTMPGLGDRLAARVAGEIGEHVCSAFGVSPPSTNGPHPSTVATAGGWTRQKACSRKPVSAVV